MNATNPVGETDFAGDRGAWAASFAFAAVILLGFGLLYSVSVASLGGLLFPATANGSLIERDGVIVGSSLVAQPFADARYFQPRPSAASYDPMAAAGSNQARSNPALQERVAAAISAVAARYGIAESAVPFDLVTQSGSGLDPHVSVFAARVQIARVAQMRGVPVDAVAGLVEQHIEPPQFGLLGPPRVNVLQLNLALDALR